MLDPFSGKQFRYVITRDGKQAMVELDGAVPQRLRSLSKRTLRFVAPK